MFVVMRQDATDADVERVVAKIGHLGFEPHVSRGVERTVIGVKGPRDRLDPGAFAGMDGVLQVVRVTAPHKLASREWRPADSVVEVGDGDGPTARIGEGGLTFIAGPCAVENRESLFDAARAAREGGARMLRGGAFKPRTSPYDFQGLGEEGVKLLAEASREFGLPAVTEARSAAHVEIIVRHCDMIQIGARSMQNFDLLKEVGRADKPVLLKRGMSAKVRELLMSAEYILSEGNEKVVLCERGIRTFEDATRFTLDCSAVPVLKAETHLPVVIDPSHAAGNSRYVAALARAGVAAGADGIMVEIHPRPAEALCDAAQALTPAAFARLVRELEGISRLLRGAGATATAAGVGAEGASCK
ncbi:MAG: 3-deoxy-7-phosphoheptulonate synthase [Planctomycetota bacterium]|jgi:3-deoxy-7-phosphoheptulonate synthase